VSDELTSLWDDLERHDPSPASHEEQSFAFLNRVDGPYWARVRATLDEWFLRYPAGDDRRDLRGRFRDKDPGRHQSAWWELYLHEMLRRMGYTVEVHPRLADTRARPDFAVSTPTETMLVEAAVVFSGIVEQGRDPTREAWILDAINRTNAPDFFLGVNFDHVGSQRPRVVEVTQPIERWLATLNPDGPVTRELPELRLTVHDWRFRVTASPVLPEHRGEADHQPLGFGPPSGGMVDDISQLGDTLRRKASKYGEPEVPLILAVNCASSFMTRHDVEQALIGRVAVQYNLGAGPPPRWIRQRDGVWMGPRGPRARRVSGVLVGTQVHPHNCGTVIPELWLNPWATHPVTREWPFPINSATDEGEPTVVEATPSMHELLGLAEDWPGPEPPFA
jgi:hypothetical protein